jgi:hypothetical protein
MNASDLLAHLRHRSAGTRPDDHVAAPTHTAPARRCDETNPPAPKPQEPPQRPAPTPAGGTRPGKLAALTPALGRQKAGQALWAPSRLTPAERKIADRILKDFDHA